MFSSMQYIDYYSLDTSLHANFFKQKKQFLLNHLEEKVNNARINKLNTILGVKQKEYQEFQSSLEQKLADCIVNTSLNNTFETSLEQMAQNIDGYQLEAIQKADATITAVKQREYMVAYQNFENLMQQVLMSPNSNITVDTKAFESMLQKLNFSQLHTFLPEIGNSLGYIGELSGAALQIKLIDNLLSTFDNKVINGQNVKVHISNVGTKNTINTNKRVTTDNLAVISAGNSVLFSLNLSSKFNTKYLGKKTRSSTVKLATKTVNAFLEDHPDFSSPVFNTLSYHWDSGSNTRRDTVLQTVSATMRETVGGQMLLDSILGTGDYVGMGAYSFEDTVSLISYGGKLYATLGILEVVKKRQKFNKAQIDLRSRQSWLPNGYLRGASIFCPPEGAGVYDAQRKISQFTMTYSQSLGKSLN